MRVYKQHQIKKISIKTKLFAKHDLIEESAGE